MYYRLCLSTHPVLGVHFSSDDYIVHETDGSVDIVIYREIRVNYADNYHFSTTSSSSDTSKIQCVMCYVLFKPACMLCVVIFHY